ncbi:alpha/beta fold hydrolase [Kitasatospora viridis]|uniref:Pimeloyl-ACP methyl ester carboxylesterase n=1 Tax=Kitasatospora viridis TaxID=281105 RepID=A0A561UFD6_9ACTN|nr:alpha/beta fold hydrolase [Kitasatospora viridis]TWF98064.1 pimeloyl-ACP methyl ester carboxylesterase [Kitasatospora viridis]
MSTPPFLTLPACARAARLTTARGEFAVLRAEPAGRVRGTALLVPGFTGSKEDFIALLEPLAEAGYRTVALDQRGQFETGGPADRSAYALPEMGRDLAAVTGALADGGPLHLLAHSFGGFVAREAVLAAAGPLPWSSLTLLSTGPGPICAAEAARTKMLMDALEGLDLETIWQIMQQMEGEDASRHEPEIAEFLHRRWVANVPESLLGFGERLLGEPDRTAELAAVALPKLYVSGEQDYAWPVEEQEATAGRLDAAYHRVAGAGHSPNAERPAETAALLTDFWGTIA